MSVQFADLKAGDRAKILGFKLDNLEYRQRLLALGLVPDTEIVVVRVAPLGDPIEIKIRHFSLCVRKQEGCILELAKMEPF